MKSTSRPRRKFFAFTRDQAAAVIDSRDYIPRVYGPAPAIVFDPLPPMASIKRILAPRRAQIEHYFKDTQVSTTKIYVKKSDWIERMIQKHGYGKTRMILMYRGYDCDHRHGFDDGERIIPREY